MFSIGILGFIVWSLLVGLFNSDIKVINFAIYWNSHLKIITNVLSENIIYKIWTESVRNDMYYLINIIFFSPLNNLNNLNSTQNSSESLRERSFNFTNFNLHHKYIESSWLEWFIGFTEGDGAILTSNPSRMSFVITQKEPNILYHIQTMLGFGDVKYDKGALAYRFIVRDINDIIKLAYLFNGNLHLDHRIKQLACWISILQTKSISIHLISNKIKFNLNDAWLSGFTDAEGCFNVLITERKANVVGYRTKLRFIIDQNDKSVLNYISQLFDTGYVYNRNNPITAYRYILETQSKISVIITYFESFPLKTIKKEALIKWTHIYSLMLNKEHLNKEGFEKIRNLAKLVNDKNSILDPD